MVIVVVTDTPVSTKLPRVSLQFPDLLSCPRMSPRTKRPHRRCVPVSCGLDGRADQGKEKARAPDFPWNNLTSHPSQRTRLVRKFD